MYTNKYEIDNNKLRKTQRYYYKGNFRIPYAVTNSYRPSGGEKLTSVSRFKYLGAIVPE